MKNLCHDGRCPGQDSNQAPPEYESRTLPGYLSVQWGAYNLQWRPYEATDQRARTVIMTLRIATQLAFSRQDIPPPQNNNNLRTLISQGYLSNNKVTLLANVTDHYAECTWKVRTNFGHEFHLPKQEIKVHIKICPETVNLWVIA
jgi:hypothetical protein